MRLENIQVRDPIFDELWPDQLSRSMPLIQIRNKDRIPKEILPLSVKWLPLAIVTELGSEYGLDILWLGSEDATTASGAGFNGIAASFGVSEEAVPDLEVLVVHCTIDGSGDEVDICIELSS
jgi:hypothetical protein